jgi:hypothetical protein
MISTLKRMWTSIFRPTRQTQQTELEPGDVAQSQQRNGIEIIEKPLPPIRRQVQQRRRASSVPSLSEYRRELQAMGVIANRAEGVIANRAEGYYAPESHQPVEFYQPEQYTMVPQIQESPHNMLPPQEGSARYG